MLVIVCPGQGAQKPGFLAPWIELPGVRERLGRLGESAGIDLITHGTVSDADTIRDTAVAQPLLVAAGIIAAAQLGDDPAAHADLIAGHSVGEVTAAAVSRVLDDEQAMELVGVRGRAMAEAAAVEDTSMLALVGGVRHEVMDAIERHGLYPANINSSAQVVAAGTRERLAALRDDPPTRTRAIPLDVAGAFHTPFMQTARDKLAAHVEGVTPRAPQVPLVSNAGGVRVDSGADYLSSIVSQVASPVDWEACMRTMSNVGVSAMIELAPAGTLTGMAKRELRGIELVNLNTPNDLDAARALIREHRGTAPEEA